MPVFAIAFFVILLFIYSFYCLYKDISYIFEHPENYNKEGESQK